MPGRAVAILCTIASLAILLAGLVPGAMAQQGGTPAAPRQGAMGAADDEQAEEMARQAGLLLGDPTYGFGPGRRPKRAKACMDDREQKAEALIRTGIILREIGRECSRRRINFDLLQIWYAFDAANGEQIQAAARLRGGALERNFPTIPNVAFRLDSRLIASTGLQQMANEECQVAQDLVAGFADYNAFVRHATRTELGRVKSSYPLCASRNDRGDR